VVEVGDKAQNFSLEGTDGKEIREYTLSEVASERPALLVFYVHDFSPVCTEQMCEVADAEFLTFNDNTAVLGISSDGPYSHSEFIEQNNISSPLLSDDEKTVYEQFDLIEGMPDGTRQTKRGLVLLDDSLTVQYRWQANNNWDEWTMDPVSDAREVITELIS
jgi:peroxiredoxin Q/BCP